MIIAFAMYSKIPMPRVDWSKENMRYVMACFPLVGVVIGALEYVVLLGLGMVDCGRFARGVILSLIPIFVTGGIHMDGFMDTMDARSSWGDREKKLMILKDSHAGAFAILGCVVYSLCAAAVWSEFPMDRQAVALAGLAFVLSRCLSGLGVTIFQCAKDSGLAHTFHSSAHKTVVRNLLFAEIAVVMVLMLGICWQIALAEIAVGLAVFGYYRWFSYRDFGGINGDMAGYFLQLCELFMVLAVVVAARIVF